jgi:hypothetical protein
MRAVRFASVERTKVQDQRDRPPVPLRIFRRMCRCRGGGASRGNDLQRGEAEAARVGR